MANLTPLFTGLARGVAGYRRGQLEREQLDQEQEERQLRDMLAIYAEQRQAQAAQEAAEDRRQQRLQAANSALDLARYRKEQLRLRSIEVNKPPPPRNIDPLSPEGIGASVNRARQVAPYQHFVNPTAGWDVKETPEGLVRINVRTGQVEAVVGPGGQQMQGTTRATTTEGERKAAALLMQAENAFPAIQNYQPSIRARELSRVPVIGNVLAGRADPEGQAAQQAGFQFADAYLRFVSGAAVPEQEVRRYMATFLPQPGDQPETVKRKQEAQRTILESLRVGAGRLGDRQRPDTTSQKPAGRPSDYLNRRP